MPRPSLPSPMLVHLFMLYVGQGLVGGLLAVALPVVLHERGFAAQTIGLIYLCMLPWVLKFLWAGLVDRYGERRQWIVPLQAGLCVMLALVASIGELQGLAFVVALGALMTLVSLLMAAQDVAVDAYAVDLAVPHQRGLVNAVQVAGASTGALLGGGGVLVLLPRWGWGPSLALLAGTMLVVLLSVWRMRTPRRAPPPAGEAARPHPARLLRRHGALRWIGFAVLLIVAQRLALVMIGPFLMGRAVDVATVGWLQGVGGTLAALLAALACGVVLRRVSLAAALSFIVALQAGVWLALAGIASGQWPAPSWLLLAALVLAQSALVSAAFVVFYAIAMGWCSAEQPATDFAVFQSIDSALAIACAALAGQIVQQSSYTALFAMTALLLAGTWVALWRGLRQPGLQEAT